MIEIFMSAHFGSFAEDKDGAAEIRKTSILPCLSDSREHILLDFLEVDGVTQSFIHALIADVIRQNPNWLSRINFKNCAEDVRSIIEIVVEYSQFKLGDENDISSL